MRKPKIVMQVMKEDVGYSASAKVKNISINTEGDTLEELKANIVEAVNLAFEDKWYVHNSEEIELRPDLASFFEFFKVINVKALSERMGMNQSLLAQYISGKKKPSPNQTERILREVHKLGKELSEIVFLKRTTT